MSYFMLYVHISLRYFHQDLTDPALTFTAGYMTVPNGIGLGATVQETLLEHYSIAKEIWTYSMK